MSKSIALILVLFVSMGSASAMSFTWLDPSTVRASGSIEAGDAAKFAALQKFSALELDSSGGLVDEALTMARNMDSRGGIRTVVRSGANCASACAIALFMSGETRVVYMGGRLGFHFCRGPDGVPVLECNENMAANATRHGLPWSFYDIFGIRTKSTDMFWLSAEDAECWGFMKWNAAGNPNNGLACWEWITRKTEKRAPDEVTAENANDVLCRMNAGSSRTYVTSARDQQGFTDAYRSACGRVAADPATPKYAAIDIILWLSLTDPNVEALKPVTLMMQILDSDAKQVDECWKCIAIIGMTDLHHNLAKEAVVDFQKAVNVVVPEMGGVPSWLASRLDFAMGQAAKQNH